ncbi:MAG: ABC transporter permease [Pseudomonadota bacterium]
MTHPIWIVLRKEVIDGFRDRRALMSAMLFPVLGPVLVYVMMSAVVNLRTESEDTTIRVAGADNAPHLMQWLEERGVAFQPFTGDPQAAVQQKKVELVLVIPPGFGASYASARPARVEIVQDGSRTDTQALVGRLRNLLRAYNSEIAGLRLIARGVAPNLMQVVSIQDIDVASKRERSAAALNMIPMYIILAAFVAGMGIAIDSTAGERERKSLEALLINPVERLHLVLGKWLAASAFAGVGVTLTAILCTAAMAQVPLAEIGLRFEGSTSLVLLMIIATLPVALFATALQLALAMFARSFKDAQSYMGLLVMLPLIPSLFLMFNPVATKDWMFVIPVVGQQLLIVDLIGGKVVPPLAYGLSILANLVLGIALATLTARLLQRESIIRG